jgi:hypothetical protein
MQRGCSWKAWKDSVNNETEKEYGESMEIKTVKTATGKRFQGFFARIGVLYGTSAKTPKVA